MNEYQKFTSRFYTNKILEYTDENIIDKNVLIRDLLNWLSEDSVKEFFNHYGYDEIDEVYENNDGYDEIDNIEDESNELKNKDEL